MNTARSIALVALLGGSAVLLAGCANAVYRLEAGPIRIQPSELMKPAVVLAMARFYETLPAGMIGTWRSLVPAGALIAMPMGLVLMQPDLGTSVAIAFGGVVVMFLAGLPLWWFLLAGGVGGIPFAAFAGSPAGAARYGTWQRLSYGSKDVKELAVFMDRVRVLTHDMEEQERDLLASRPPVRGAWQARVITLFPDAFPRAPAAVIGAGGKLTRRRPSIISAPSKRRRFAVGAETHDG